MKHIDVDAIRSNPEARLAFLTDFCLFSDDDWSALDMSLPYLAPRLPELLDRIYEHLLAYDDTRRVFLGERGKLDPEYIELRKEHMTEWIMSAITIKDPGEFARYAVRTGKRHTGVSGEPNRSVAPRYLVALMSFIQTCILEILFDEMAENMAGLRQVSLAWNKMLMIQLELFLKVAAPAWPQWDEA